MQDIQELRQTPKTSGWLKAGFGWLRKPAAAAVYPLAHPLIALRWIFTRPGAMVAAVRNTTREMASAFRDIRGETAPYWKSEVGSTGKKLLLTLAGFSVVNALVSWAMTEASVPYSNYMKDGPINSFFLALLFLAFWWLCSSTISATAWSQRKKLHLSKREWLTVEGLKLFLLSPTLRYLRLSQDTRENKPDNPDQRLTQEPATLCEQLVNLMANANDAILGIVVMGWQLATVYPMLIPLSFGVAVVMSGLMGFLSKAQGALTYRGSTCEADLRGLVRSMIDDAEAIALSRSEQVVFDSARKQLSDTVGVLHLLRKLQQKLDFCNTFYGYTLQAIPIALVITFYFQGNFPFGVLGKVLIAFPIVTGGFTFFVTNLGSFYAVATAAKRKREMKEKLVGYDREAIPGEAIEFADGPSVGCEDLTVVNELGQRVITRLTLDLGKLRKVYVMAPDESNPGVLLMALDQDWRKGSGKVTGPNRRENMFLDQESYHPAQPLTLAEALTHGLATKESLTDDDLLDALRRAQLPRLAQQAGGLHQMQRRSWRKILTSASARQRLAFARTLLRKPKYVFLNKCFATLQPMNVKKLYEELDAIGCLVISVGTDPSYAQYHDYVLEIRPPESHDEGKSERAATDAHGDGDPVNWSIQPVTREKEYVPSWFEQGITHIAVTLGLAEPKSEPAPADPAPADEEVVVDLGETPAETPPGGAAGEPPPGETPAAAAPAEEQEPPVPPQGREGDQHSAAAAAPDEGHADGEKKEHP
jgi:putative ATP-binding cassette transporter